MSRWSGLGSGERSKSGDKKNMTWLEKSKSMDGILKYAKVL